jgi:multiple sugar transport system substrate-binding protein
MRNPVRIAGPIALATLVAVGGLTGTARARVQAAPVTITIDYDQYGPPPYQLTEWLSRVKQQVEAMNSGITVKLNPIVASEGDYYTKVDLALRSANTTPDLVYEDSFLVSSDVTAGYLQPLDKYLATWPEYKEEWFPGMQQITTFNGHNYGTMIGTDVRLIYYNKNVFKKAGLPVSWQPHSWADLLSAARAIKAKVPGVIPFNVYSGVPADEASTMQGFEMLLYGTKDAAHLYDYKTNKWVINSTGIKDTLKFLQTVYNPSDLLGPTNDIALSALGYAAIHNGLTKGTVGFGIDGSWIPGDWLPGGAFPNPNWKNVIGVAKMPTEYGQAPGYVTLSGGWALSISSKSTHKDQAFTVLKQAMSLPNVAYYDTIATQIATRKDVVNVPSYKALPLSSFTTSLVSFTQFRPAFPAYPQISEQIDLAMENAMSGQNVSDVQSAYAAAVTGIAGANNVEKLP